MAKPKQPRQPKTAKPKPEESSRLERLVKRIDPWLGVAGISVYQAMGMVVTPIAYWIGATSDFMGPMLTAFFLWLALAFLGIAAGPKNAPGNSYWMPRWVRAALCITAIVMMGYGGHWIYRNHWAYRPHATLYELSQTYISNRTFYFAEVPMTRDAAIQNKVFENCTIIGPSIVAPAGGPGSSSMSHIELTGDIETGADAVLIEAVPGKHYIGAIRFDGVTIHHCSMPYVGFLLSRQQIDKWTAEHVFNVEDFKGDIPRMLDGHILDK